ncbi:MAG: response regulator [Planctomycetes bacterium]|nr:response regulator [Planctomycetota bacterium]
MSPLSVPPPGSDVTRVRTVLVVDDDTNQRQLVHDILEMHGYTVVGASSVREGLTALQQMKPSAIVLDLSLPGADGFSFLRELRAWPERKRIPVLVVSASILQEDAIKALEAGANGYLAKPISVTEFPEALRRAIAGEGFEYQRPASPKS